MTYAIFDKDNKRVSGIFDEPKYAWKVIPATKRKDYTCQKGVFVREGVYKHISEYVGDVLEEYGADAFPFDGQYPAAKEFLSAGKE